MEFWMYTDPTNIQDYLNLTISYMTILQYQFTHCVNVFRGNKRFWKTFMKLVVERTTRKEKTRL